MRIKFWILGAVIAVGVARSQNAPALEHLPFQRWVEIKNAAGTLTSFGPPKQNAIANKWSLSEQNITTEISEAWRYKDKIVVFGWSGNTVGVVTVIDASTGKEDLQLPVKEDDRFITGGGALLYSHWSVKGAYEPDDSLWLLNLDRPLPAPSSELPNGIVVEIGTEIYPGSSDKPFRHAIHNLLIGAKDQELFFTDWLSTDAGSTQVCLVRIGSFQLHQMKMKRNCVDQTTLSGYLPGDIQSSSLEFDHNGALRFSLTFLREPADYERFVVDPVTLATSKSNDKGAASNTDRERSSPLRVPWDVEKRSFAGGSAINLKQRVFAGHERDRLVADLVISEAGAVMNVRVTGSTSEVRRQIEVILRTWHFKPTVLDGRATKVRVRIESSPEGLSIKS